MFSYRMTLGDADLPLLRPDARRIELMAPAVRMSSPSGPPAERRSALPVGVEGLRWRPAGRAIASGIAMWVGETAGAAVMGSIPGVRATTHLRWYRDGAPRISHGRPMPATDSL